MIPLYSTEQVRSADKYAIDKLQIPGELLMENAAISIINSIFEYYPYLDDTFTFGIVCGKGNNGGDGFALARHLLLKGFKVNVLSLAKETELKGDAFTNYKILKNFIKPYTNSWLGYFKTFSDLKRITNSEIIVDAILGTGSSGELVDPFKKIIEKLNDTPSLKIAIDSPTGLNLENSNGETIFNANLTVTLAELKTGLFYEKGKLNSGQVLKGSIGIGESYFNSLIPDSFLIEPEDALNGLPKKEQDLHKYSAGKVLVIAGSAFMPGAAIYSINAAMISGAGAGKLAFPNSIQNLAQLQMNSAIVKGFNDENKGFLSLSNLDEVKNEISWADIIAVGPGLGRDPQTSEAVINLLKNHESKRFVIDADAIFAIKNKQYKKVNLRENVLTPHHKEFADLLGIELSELKANLLYYGRKFSSETGSFLVLKGAPSIIFNPDGEVFINSSGNAGLAKFGSGDVLTGIIASFMAQQKDIEKSVISAVYIHGFIADLIMKKESEFGITPNKLINNFGKTIKFLRQSIV